ncbi:hypothetical protein HDG32_004672 [Paraburkholderia sp. CI2]|uniref:hypothetical protein n=1 Tax=Paraburkholderia sp. CI2 TaxID=2723093 RepID=UPI00160BF645|nr:hypothetical protein [Paraburkholderia sp. CI2]MBB5468542.1 hypothetical protein [Paraburkholderia sp. CI2]
MTINIALVTSGAVVFGCDSISSETDYFLRPLDYVVKDEGGNFVFDEDGRVTAKFSLDRLQNVVTNSFGGVTKMFSISHGGVEAAAVTSGLATIGGKTISALADEYCAQDPAAETLAQVAEDFLAFMRRKYGEVIPLEYQYVPEIEFLIGGYESASPFSGLYRIRVRENTCVPVYVKGNTGVGWSGQSDGVERLIFGIDGQLRSQIMLAVNETLDKFQRESNENFARILRELMAAADLNEIPEGVNTDLVAKPAFVLATGSFQLDIDYANLPLQDAVDFVSYLVNLQSGRAKFARGVATVGGRTHIGVVTRSNRLRMLSEPELVHRNVGFGNDQ